MVGRGRNIPLGGQGLGIGGKCVCTSCGHEVPHEAGVPCISIKCSNCGSMMRRKLL